MATKSHQAVFAPNIVAELMAGNTQTTFSVRDYTGKAAQVTLTHLIACDLCDTPESPLRSILAYLGSQAKAGDLRALTLVHGIASDIEREYHTEDREPDPQDRRDAAAECLGVTQA